MSRDKSNGQQQFFLSRSSWRVRTVEEGRWPAWGHPCRCCSLFLACWGGVFTPRYYYRRGRQAIGWRIHVTTNRIESIILPNPPSVFWSKKKHHSYTIFQWKRSSRRITYACTYTQHIQRKREREREEEQWTPWIFPRHNCTFNKRFIKGDNTADNGM